MMHVPSHFHHILEHYYHNNTALNLAVTKEKNKNKTGLPEFTNFSRHEKKTLNETGPLNFQSQHRFISTTFNTEQHKSLINANNEVFQYVICKHSKTTTTFCHFQMLTLGEAVDLCLHFL